mgnify:CR=1 FL=1
MKNKILKNEPVPWRECQWLQTKTFKEITDAGLERLIQSMLKLDYISSLKVWRDKKGVTWILDGHHRQRALEEIERRGHEIPDLLPAEFIDCKDRREAARYCFAYASTYARVTEQGITDMIEEFDLNLEDLSDSIEIHGIDLESFNMGDEIPTEGVGEEEEREIPNRNIESGDMERAEEKLENQYKKETAHRTGTCPACAHEFEVDL